ncbi:MAG TPA: type II toxin-antitoxin system HicB family antitoxin [Bryobacteraceae bacterium]|nr:type II toxin-antitoxin system HicB family antitoxin [Bryobacteraceae bacterium]
MTIAGHPSKEAAPCTLKSIFTQAGAKTMKYVVIYEKTGTGYSSYAPDLPGCVAAGDDSAETKALMERAIEMHLRGMRETGILFP